MIDWRLGVYENAAVAAADDDELLLKRPLLIKVRSSCFFYVSDLFPLFPPLALDLSPLKQYTSEEKKCHHAIDWFASIKVSPQLL